MYSNLIIITGLPGTGKTALGQFLAKELNLPFITKDAIKELLFDSLGWSDRAWSKKVGHAAYSILDYLVEEELKAGHSLVLESNFKPEFDNQKFQMWQEKYDFKTIQIVCSADGSVLYERFKARALSGERHLGHGDARNLEEFKELLETSKSEPLDLIGDKIEVDTTDFTRVNYSTVLNKVRETII